MPDFRRIDDEAWGELKKQKAFMLTPTASKLVDDAADAMGVSRSEALERIIRHSAPLAPNFPQACNS